MLNVVHLLQISGHAICHVNRSGSGPSFLTNAVSVEISGSVGAAFRKRETIGMFYFTPICDRENETRTAAEKFVSCSSGQLF